MSKKIFGGGKKKVVEEPKSALPVAKVTALSPEEIKRRRLLPKPAFGGSILGGASGLSQTLGG